MFEKIKFAIATKRIFKSWGGNPNNPTINEMIVVTPIMLLSSRRKQSSLFSNKYVCADAAIITCAYVVKILKGTGAPDNIISDLKSKMVSAVQCEFLISKPELQELQKNRFSFFNSLLDEHEEDISPMIEEASLIFAHDLHHNKYVEYSKDSPLIILGIDKQLQIESETLAYFNIALKLVTDYLKQYFR